MASQKNAPPSGTDSDDQAPSESAAADSPKTFIGEYVDGVSRTYQFPGAGPQTAEFGDVCELPHDPGDGRWRPSKAKVTRLPDNHPDEREKTSERQAAARQQLHADAEASRKGGAR